MKKLIPLALILAAATVLAQPARHGNMKNMPKFDAATIQTITGTIASLDRQNHGNHTGIFLAVSTGSTTIPVHVGPEAFLTEHAFAVAQGDTITVTASMKRMRGADTLIASRIQNGAATIDLRDAAGKPLWASTYCNR